MPDKKTVRDELANLTEAVRELREDEVTAELRRLRAEVAALRVQQAAPTTHHCIGCSCMRIHYYPAYPVVPGCAGVVPPLIYTTNVSGTSAPEVTSVAAGCNPAVTTLSISN